MYEIEELIKTFGKHYVEGQKINAECIERHKEYNPGEPLPEFLTQEFSFPLALQAMCREIAKLKERAFPYP